ncbi:B- and T-lymphocyte attenuator isoform X3 [Callorhinus ursinus]|uniref:B- and T-lymphocyte attenuator isoform X3 n=1 Tax=Callorhinus ursinus TaxID=34884 RepID=A0A3Q7P8P0_CALUR|nr:B- and T-lymphocyte attenuator isoform X3 [Callorhinus ursinus]
MKTLPGMLGIGKLCWVFFLIPHLGIWSINGEKSCNEQLYVKRYSIYTVSAGNSFDLKCPVKYCTNRPNVIWCKLEGKSCLSLGYKLQGYTSWNENENISVFILHFNHMLPGDTGSYRCSANFSSGLVESHSVTINVTAEQKKLSDTAGREINLVDIPQPFRSEQTEVGTRQNPQTLPSETCTYDNDPWFRVQEESEVYSNPCLEENKQSIVYASLNHSVIGINPRQAKNVKEAPTEYAAICVRN